MTGVDYREKILRSKMGKKCAKWAQNRVSLSFHKIVSFLFARSNPKCELPYNSLF